MQNDMRNRLANLICEAEGKVNNEYPTIEMVADYLIANGVIVPPCKVGDTVYNIEYNIIIKKWYVVKKWYVDSINNTGECWNCKLKSNKNKYKYDFRFVRFDDFGKTVFLTKEEAEAKLKELNHE